jgi:hypothetical protein
MNIIQPKGLETGICNALIMPKKVPNNRRNENAHSSLINFFLHIRGTSTAIITATTMRITTKSNVYDLPNHL